MKTLGHMSSGGLLWPAAQVSSTFNGQTLKKEKKNTRTYGTYLDSTVYIRIMYTEKTECVSIRECIHNILNRPHNIIYTSGERERERERGRERERERDTHTH